jgi:AraC family transcriptional regulator of adaptative response/methylated-DNA-[protein]-cysteine methyltransferase
MLTTSIANAAAQSLPADRSRDYDLIRRAIAFLSETWAEQPSLDRLAAHLGLSPAHCQKLFKRWCGLSPKEFVQAITVDHARALLDGSASVLDAAHEVGLSGGSRLHDLFVSHEAMTPGDYKRRGEGLDMAYGFHASPFSEALLIATDRGVAGLAFVDEDKGQTREDALADMMQRWPRAHYVEAPERIAPLLAVRSATVMPDFAVFRASAPGVYQIGELQARSCTMAGTTSGGAMPSCFAWMVDQRGVGISRARA